MSIDTSYDRSILAQAEQAAFSLDASIEQEARAKDTLIRIANRLRHHLNRQVIAVEYEDGRYIAYNGLDQKRELRTWERLLFVWLRRKPNY